MPSLALAIKCAVACPHRRRPWSRPISAATPAGACSAAGSAAASPRADQRGAVVQRPARLHPHHRQRAAGRDHPAAQRLCRGRDLGDPRAWRRRAQADRRRHAGDLHRRTSPRRPARSAMAAEGALRRRLGELNRRRRRGRPADHRHLSRAAYRRGVLRQYRQQASGSTSPWSARRSTRSAASPRCAARPSATC